MTPTPLRSIGRLFLDPPMHTGNLGDRVYLRCTGGRTDTNRNRTSDKPNSNSQLTDAPDIIMASGLTQAKDITPNRRNGGPFTPEVYEFWTSLIYLVSILNTGFCKAVAIGKC